MALPPAVDSTGTPVAALSYRYAGVLSKLLPEQGLHRTCLALARVDQRSKQPIQHGVLP
jgi:hypothetical protein